MYHNGIPTFIWAQNIAHLIIAGLVSYFIVSNKATSKGDRFSVISISASLLLIVLTFINPGMEGVHRWVSIGIIKLDASMKVLPTVIVSLWELLQTKPLWVSIITTIFISILLAIQPDASQLTGFAIPMMIMLCYQTNKKTTRLFIIGILSAIVILSWVFLDSLPAVAHVVWDPCGLQWV